jgi:hypothetical protein
VCLVILDQWLIDVSITVFYVTVNGAMPLR